MTRRFLLFAFDQYYPHGGWSDFEGSFDTLGEAKESPLGKRMDAREIVDSETGTVVCDSYSGKPWIDLND